MRAVIQRVRRASVEVNGNQISSIQKGILTLLGVQKGDSDQMLQDLIKKIIDFRIFEDENGKMNKSLLDIQGEHLIVSQFTLAADVSTGRRPSFGGAEVPAIAKQKVDQAVMISQGFGVRTVQGEFGADMKVELINDGPATFVFDL